MSTFEEWKENFYFHLGNVLHRKTEEQTLIRESERVTIFAVTSNEMTEDLIGWMKMEGE